MKTLRLPIYESELDSFKEACANTAGIEFISFNDGWSEITYCSDQGLYFLGRRFELYDTYNQKKIKS